MKKSKWFDGAKFVPAHVGVYETDRYKGAYKTYQYWDGKFFSYFSPSIQGAFNYRKFKSSYQSPTWRGIKK